MLSKIKYFDNSNVSLENKDMKKIVISLFLFLIVCPLFALDLTSVYSYFDIGPTVGVASALNVPYAGVAASFGSSESTGKGYDFGTGGQVIAAMGATDWDKTLPLVVGAYGGAVFSFDLGALSAASITLGPAIAWESKIAYEGEPGMAMLALGCGIDLSMDVYFTPRQSFGMFIDVYGNYLFNLADVLDVPRHSYLLGGSVGLVFKYDRNYKANIVEEDVVETSNSLAEAIIGIIL